MKARLAMPGSMFTFIASLSQFLSLYRSFSLGFLGEANTSLVSCGLLSAELLKSIKNLLVLVSGQKTFEDISTLMDTLSAGSKEGKDHLADSNMGLPFSPSKVVSLGRCFSSMLNQLCFLLKQLSVHLLMKTSGVTQIILNQWFSPNSDNPLLYRRQRHQVHDLQTTDPTITQFKCMAK